MRRSRSSASAFFSQERPPKAAYASPTRGEVAPNSWNALTLSRRPTLVPDTKNLPRFRRARNLPPRPPRAGRDRLDQLSVRCHLGAVGQVKRILEPGAQMAAEISAALVQRPDFGAADRGYLPMRVRRFQLQQNRQQIRIGRHARGDTHDKIIFQRP